MDKAVVRYPFVPKSTAFLEPGQFWGIPLKRGRYACGRVLQLCVEDGKRAPRTFLAGLMDWTGRVPPTSEMIAGRDVLDQGQAHILTITENGRDILGCRPLELDGIELGLFLDESPGPRCHLRRGFDILGLASRRQQAELEVFLTWGYAVIKELTEEHFGRHGLTKR